MRSSPSPSPIRRRPSCANGSGPSWRGAPRPAPSQPGELLPGIGGAWVTTIHGFCNRLLAGHPVAAGIDPRFRVLDAPETERAAREAFEEALEEFLAADEESREDTVAAFEVEGLRTIVAGAHAELRSRGLAEPRLPEPPHSDRAAAIRRAADAAAEAIGESEAETTRSGSDWSGPWRRWRAAPVSSRASTNWRRCAPTAARRRSPPTERRSRRRSPAPPRPARAASPTATSRPCWSSTPHALRPPSGGARGSTSRICKSSPRGCWSGERSARLTARGSAT